MLGDDARQVDVRTADSLVTRVAKVARDRTNPISGKELERTLEEASQRALDSLPVNQRHTLGQLMQRRADVSPEMVRGASWFLQITSVFVAKPRGWRIPVYLVLTYFAVAMMSFSMYPLASVALNPQFLSAECRGWNEYLIAIGPVIDSVNARDAAVSGGAYASEAGLRRAITNSLRASILQEHWGTITRICSACRANGSGCTGLRWADIQRNPCSWNSMMSGYSVVISEKMEMMRARATKELSHQH
jgi:hypothetical protein